jgi:hypothetical protein
LITNLANHQPHGMNQISECSLLNFQRMLQPPS